jgi:acetylornithine deacetylase/succinyl-diaminopimelate desuccinylase-like protein
MEIKMLYKEQIHNFVQTHKEEIIETLKELIKIPSIRGVAEKNAPFGKECARVLGFAQELYEKNGFKTELNQTTDTYYRIMVTVKKVWEFLLMPMWFR